MHLIYQYPILSVLQSAFMIWMLIDAYRKGAETFWYYVILFVPVLGAWAYFFVVKLPDFKNLHWPALLQRRESLDELRFRCEQTPTMAANLTLAQRLMENDQFNEALEHLLAAAKVEPDHGQVLFCTARCYARLGQPESGRPLLDRLIQKDPRWSGYAAWHFLVEILDETGEAAASLETCRNLVKLAPSMHHQYLLAKHLLDGGHTEEGTEILERSLREFQFVTGLSRRHNRRWASAAQQLLKRATSKS
jgi:hypothetical protein